MTPPISPINQRTAGGSSQYVASGTCSGTAYLHSQTLNISYELIAKSEEANTWPPTSCNSVSGLKLTIMGSVNGSLFDFNTSSTNGSGTDCSSAANARELQEFVLSSTSTSAANVFGTQGMIYTASAGMFRRWADVSDINFDDSRRYGNAWFTTAGLPPGWELNTVMSKQVLKSIVNEIIAGGLQFSDSGSAPPSTTLPWGTFDSSLIHIP